MKKILVIADTYFYPPRNGMELPISKMAQDLKQIMKMEKLLVWVSISIMMEIYLLGNTKILIMYLKEMESELFIIAMVNNLPLLGPMEKY